MLVLSRFKDESIVIRDNIIITIVDIRGDKVRLGIQAPINISVHRQEIYDTIKKEESKEKETKPGNLETNVQLGTSQNDLGQHNRYPSTNY